MDDNLFQGVSELAEKSQKSRSRIISEAVRDYLERQKSLQVLEAINQACRRSERPEEKLIRHGHRHRYARRFMNRSW